MKSRMKRVREEEMKRVKEEGTQMLHVTEEKGGRDHVI